MIYKKRLKESFKINYMDKNNIKNNNVYISEEEKTLNWEEVRASFEKTFGSEIYNSWLQKNIIG